MLKHLILTSLAFCFATVAWADAGVISRTQMGTIQKNTETFKQTGDPVYQEEFAIYANPHPYAEARGGYDLVTIGNHNYHDNTPVVGGDLGYQFNSFTALEAGGLYLFDIQSKTSTLSNIQQWNGYGALKLIFPIMQRLNGFTKVGVQYTEYHTEAASGAAAVTHDDTEPYFAAGCDYLLNRSTYVDIQYSLIPSNNKNNTALTPNQHLLTGAIGINF